MAILKEDIKIVESAIMSNESDSGGRQTSVEIPSGVINNVFLPFSRLNAVTGVVNSRKIYTQISTTSNEVFSGAHFILLSKPNNPKVHVTLFYTGSHTDTKETVQEQIESYVVRGPRSNMNMLETQLSGQRVLTVFQDTTDLLPEIGDIFVLVENSTEEFVKIQDMTHEERRFVLPAESCYKKVITLTLSSPIINTFAGTTVQCTYTAPTSHIRTTQVADAAHYYGIGSVVVAGTVGDSSIKVDDVYTQLVPSTRIENSVIDVLALADATIPFESGSETFDLIDNVKSVDIPITISNRGYTYIGNIEPLPAIGSFTAEYRVFGRWYTIVSDEFGILSGDGSGIIDYDTGSFSITTQELPDIGTSIIYKWGMPITFEDYAGTANLEPVKITKTLGTGAIEPGTVVINWIGGGTNYTANDNGVGALIGDGVGSINYSNGKVILYPTKLPDSNQNIVFDFDYSATVTEQFTPTKDGSNFIDITVANPIKPGSIEVEWPVVYPGPNMRAWGNTYLYNHSDIDAGIGSGILRLQDNGVDELLGESTSIVNHGTGRIYFLPDQNYYYSSYE